MGAAAETNTAQKVAAEKTAAEEAAAEKAAEEKAVEVLTEEAEPTTLDDAAEHVEETLFSTELVSEDLGVPWVCNGCGFCNEVSPEVCVLCDMSRERPVSSLES